MRHGGTCFGGRGAGSRYGQRERVRGLSHRNSGRHSGVTAVCRAQRSHFSNNEKSKAILTWQPVTGAAGYEIYQKSSGSDWTYAAEVSSDTLGYTASGLSVYKKYSFKVRAYAGSSTSSKTTASSSSAAASAAAADNNYSDFSDVVSGYVITDSWSYGKLAWPIPARHHVSSYFGRRTAPTYGPRHTMKA